MAVRARRVSKAHILCALPTSPAKYLSERRQRRQPAVLVRLEHAVDEALVKGRFRALAERLCEEHRSIGMDANIKGGIPRIKGSRLSVGQVLGRLYALGSVDAVAEYYAPHISIEQIKEAIAFAQDFVETACEPPQTNG